MSGASVAQVGDTSTHAGPELVVTGGCVLAIVVSDGGVTVGTPGPSKEQMVNFRSKPNNIAVISYLFLLREHPFNLKRGGGAMVF